MATESLSVEFELSWCRGGDIEALADASSSPAAAVLSLCECIEYKLNYKVLTTSQPDYVYNLILVQSTGRTHSSSVVTLAPPPYLRLQITNRSLDMRHFICEISSLLYSVNSCLLSSWLTSFCAHHLITVPIFALIIYHSPDLSLYTPDFKLISFTNPFLRSLPGTFWTAFSDLEPVAY